MGKVVPIKGKQPERHQAFTYKGYRTYKTYVFKDKDPVIEEVRKVVEKSKKSYSEISALSGVSDTTLHNWFYGATLRPQNATIEAVLRALGHRRKVSKG